MNMQSNYEVRLERCAARQGRGDYAAAGGMSLGTEGSGSITWSAGLDEAVPEDVERLLGMLPEWFGIAEANAEYIEAARTKETWTVRDDSGGIVGVTLVVRHFPWVAEIYLAMVERSVHGTGVGTAMLTAIERDAVLRGVRLLEVKTLGVSHPDKGYARTRHFYEKLGFLALEETDLWGEDSPCLIMVKPLGEPGAAPS